MPLLDYLRDLSSMVAPEYNQVPPLTPSFSGPFDENCFHRMVDAYGLTNVLYNYDIYKSRSMMVNWSSGRPLVSQGVFDVSLQGGPEEWLCYSLDRESHGRSIQLFEVTWAWAEARGLVSVGWNCRCDTPEQTLEQFHAKMRRISICLFTADLE